MVAAQADVLPVYKTAWKIYDLGSRVINVIFQYLNDNWIRRRTEETRGSLTGSYHGAGTDAGQVFPVDKVRPLLCWVMR